MKKIKRTGVQEKRRRIVEERRNKQVKVFIIVLILAILAEAAYIGAGSKYLNIREITVAGNKSVSSEKIVKLSGLTVKDNFLYADMEMARKRVEGDPWIADAKVYRRLPLTVKITVAEREPRAVWLNAGLYYLLDKNGTVMVVAPQHPMMGLPVIKDCPIETGLEPGEKARGAALINALTVAGDLDKEIATDVSMISAPTIDGLAIQLNKGTTIMYGKAEMTKQKNYAIKVILTEGVNEGKAWQYVDVRVPSNPVAKAAA